MNFFNFTFSVNGKYQSFCKTYEKYENMKISKLLDIIMHAMAHFAFQHFLKLPLK